MPQSVAHGGGGCSEVNVLAAWIAWANDPVWGGRFHILLQAAKDLRDNDHPEAAIVTAQMAFEVCTEVLLTQTLRERGVGYVVKHRPRVAPPVEGAGFVNDPVSRDQPVIPQMRASLGSSPCPIHPSAQKVNSRNFDFRGFYEVRIAPVLTL